ncbi:MAG: TatD family hydrolase [Chlorobi bacterium]|nr:TatD family hydrolase [Chlorobiota bacterium]
MIDTHAHIDTEQFDADREEVLNRAWQSGVEAIVIPAITITRTDIAERLVDEHPWLYRAVGIHPHHAREATTALLDRVERSAEAERVVAIGEIGLDYYYDFATPAEQHQAFREQIRIAKRVGLPIIVHNRDADDDVLRIIEEEQDGTLNGVLHCFSSGLDMLRRALELGFFISFTGNITFRSWQRNDVLTEVPVGRFMLETDSPYMTPHPHRGRRNEPALVRHVAEHLASVRSTTFDDIVMTTTAAAKQLFRLMAIVAVVLVSVLTLSPSAQAAESDEDTVEYVHPYPRRIGFGGIVGPNTIVETQTLIAKGQTQPLSYEGIPAFGAAAVWEFADRWMLEIAYVFSENRKVVYDPVANPFGQQNPDRYHFLEAGVRYLFNPYSRVVFYGFFGGAASWVSRDGGPLGAPRGCVTPGIGLFINIPTSFGMFVPGGEWRLNFLLPEEERFIVMGNGERYKANISTFFSIPRFTLLYFPKW